MLLTVAGFLLLFWIIGLIFHIAGGFIHIVLVVALLIAILHWAMKGR